MTDIHLVKFICANFVCLRSGNAKFGRSGNVMISSGSSKEDSSGQISLSTSSESSAKKGNGVGGASGNISLTTGDQRAGKSGNINIATGNSHYTSGHISIAASHSISNQDGGNIGKISFLLHSFFPIHRFGNMIIMSFVEIASFSFQPLRVDRAIPKVQVSLNSRLVRLVPECHHESI